MNILSRARRRRTHRCALVERVVNTATRRKTNERRIDIVARRVVVGIDARREPTSVAFFHRSILGQHTTLFTSQRLVVASRQKSSSETTISESSSVLEENRHTKAGIFGLCRRESRFAEPETEMNRAPLATSRARSTPGRVDARGASRDFACDAHTTFVRVRRARHVSSRTSARIIRRFECVEKYDT